MPIIAYGTPTLEIMGGPTQSATFSAANAIPWLRLRANAGKQVPVGDRKSAQHFRQLIFADRPTSPLAKVDKPDDYWSRNFIRSSASLSRTMPSGRPRRTTSLCGPNGVGDLFGMAALAIAPAIGTIAGFDVELRDDGDEGWQIGLILDNDPWIDEVGLTIGAAWARPSRM